MPPLSIALMIAGYYDLPFARRGDVASGVNLTVAFWLKPAVLSQQAPEDSAGQLSASPAFL